MVDSPHKGPVMQSFGISFVVRTNNHMKNILESMSCMVKHLQDFEHIKNAAYLKGVH